jgi:PhnB protein
MHVNPYLFFDGRCEEALRFYERTLGGKIGPAALRKVPGARSPRKAPMPPRHLNVERPL